MKFIESFSSVMAPIMTGKQAPLAVDGLVQQAQRLLGVPSDKRSLLFLRQNITECFRCFHGINTIGKPKH